MRIKGFHACTRFTCLKNSHGCDLLKMCLHIQNRHCFRLFSFSLDSIYNSPPLSHFCSPWTHLFMFTITTFLFWQMRIILRIIKARTKKKFDRRFCYLVLIYTICFQLGTHGATRLVAGKFSEQNVVLENDDLSNLSNCWFEACCFLEFLIKYRFVPVQFPVIFLFGLLGNPPARICSWRTKFPASPSSFPQHRKTARRYVRELPWRQSLFLDNSEHRRANFRLSLINSEQSHKQMPV